MQAQRAAIRHGGSGVRVPAAPPHGAPGRSRILSAAGAQGRFPGCSCTAERGVHLDGVRCRVMTPGSDRRERAEAILEALDAAEQRERTDESTQAERRTKRLQEAVAGEGEDDGAKGP